nr:glycosyltransferase [Sansalvadorimonas sp. 2012CJ34-2]
MDGKGVKLSVIIPFKERGNSSIERLYWAVNCFFDFSKIEIIIFDVGANSIGYQLNFGFRRSIKYYHHPVDGTFSPGLIRNFAAKKATGDFLFFFDADLVALPGFIKMVKARALELKFIGETAFDMFPCLYLSKKATRAAYQHGFATQNDYLRSFLQGDLATIEGISVSGSCLLVNRTWFNLIGGFCEEYIGHGCEDFDLIHRLSAYYQITQLPEDYIENIKTPFPAEYQGFRKYFCYYSLPHLFEGDFLLHQWHHRPLSKTYHKRYSINAKILADRMSSPLPDITIPGTGQVSKAFSLKGEITDYNDWLMRLLQKHSLSRNDCIGLFEYKGGTSPNQRSIFRKARKLLINPKGFFKDIKFFKSRVQ